MTTAEEYRHVGEHAWAWVQAQVAYDSGPWLRSGDAGSAEILPPAERDSLYTGIAGLAFVLAELSCVRPLTDDEEALAARVRDRLVQASMETSEPSLYLGAAGITAALRVLTGHVHEPAVARLRAAARSDGWRTTDVKEPEDDFAFNDVLEGTAGIALAGVWLATDDSRALAETAADTLVRAAITTDEGLDWTAAPPVPYLMPNFSHGVAGIAAALAVTGRELDRPDLVSAAVHGARHLVSIADLSGGGFRVRHYVPEGPDNGEEPYTYSWCHGPAGTSLLFTALQHAGVDHVAGYAARDLHRRAWVSVLGSGIPQRLRPGFWDNDGRCCGTAGVGDLLLDAAQNEPDSAHREEYVTAATRMGEALLQRAIITETGACWRSIEHRLDDPLLPAEAGWMQGTAGIAAFLLRLSRVMTDGVDEAEIVDRPDQWWSIPGRLRVDAPA